MEGNGEASMNELICKIVGMTKWEVFVSYRVASDAKLAQLLYDLLTNEGLRVSLDKECLLDGVPWEEGFIKGLINSRIFLSVLLAELFKACSRGKM